VVGEVGLGDLPAHPSLVSLAAGIGETWVKVVKYGRVSQRFERWKTTVLSSGASIPGKASPDLNGPSYLSPPLRKSTW